MKSIPIGFNRGGKPHAWRALSSEAKKVLRDMRQTFGAYGGTPGKAPYWKSQEEGNPAAEIEPRMYIHRSIEQWQGQVPRIIQDWLNATRS